MCKAFSCIVTKDCKVFWKTGYDSHGIIAEMVMPSRKGSEMAKVEIVPEDMDYLKTLSGRGKWKFIVDVVDGEDKPIWFSDEHGMACIIAHEKWIKEIKSNLNIKEALNPINPFSIKPPKKITEKHIILLKEWVSERDSVSISVYTSVWTGARYLVGASVGTSVMDSVWYSVGASLIDSLWRSGLNSAIYSVGDSVRSSVGDSVRAYTGSLFNIENFNSVVKLWKMGLVPTFDGKTWRLHGGKNAKILWEGKI